MINRISLLLVLLLSSGSTESYASATFGVPTKAECSSCSDDNDIWNHYAGDYIPFWWPTTGSCATWGINLNVSTDFPSTLSDNLVATLSYVGFATPFGLGTTGYSQTANLVKVTSALDWDSSYPANIRAVVEWSTSEVDQNTGKILVSEKEIKFNYAHGMNWGGFLLLNTARHELGHVLMMADYETSLIGRNNLMDGSIDNTDYTWQRVASANEIAIFNCVYNQDKVVCCENGDPFITHAGAWYNYDNDGVDVGWNTNNLPYNVVRVLDSEGVVLAVVPATLGDHSIHDANGGENSQYVLELWDNAPDGIGLRETVYVATQSSHVYDSPIAMPTVISYLETQLASPQWQWIWSGYSEVPDMNTYQPDLCEYLIIAHESLAEAAVFIADYWSNHGVDVDLVAVPSGPATRDYIKNLIEVCDYYGQLKAVLLIGDAAACYGSDEGGSDCAANEPYHIPPFWNYDTDQNRYASDYAYGDHGDDGTLDVAIGRLPARSQNDVLFYSYKLLKYYNMNGKNGRLPVQYGGVSVFTIPTFVPATVRPMNAGDLEVQYAGEALETGWTDPYDNLNFQPDLDYWDSTGLTEYGAGTTTTYLGAIRDYVAGSILQTNLANIGIPRHSDSGSYVHSVSREESIGLRNRWNYTQSLFFEFNCHAAYWANDTRYYDSLNRTLPVRTYVEYLLFEGNSILCFGPTSPTSNVVSHEIMSGLMTRVMAWDVVTGLRNNTAIGDHWITVANGLADEGGTYYHPLRSYTILGDPMVTVKETMKRTMLGTEAPNVSVGPNPFNPMTTIAFTECRPGVATVEIYDASGRCVRTLFSGWNDSRELRFQWDGTGGGGRRVASGVYFVRYRTSDDQRVSRMCLVK